MKTVRDAEWKPGSPERIRLWAGESSMTVVRASGGNAMFGITEPALLVGGGSDISIDAAMGHQAHLFLPNDQARWPKYAIEVLGVCHNLAYRGSIEAYPGAIRVVGVSVSGLELRPYMEFQSMYDAKGAEIDSVPVVMLDGRKVESPPGSGNFTVVGAVLSNSNLAPAPAPGSSGVVGRLLDTSADASHTITGNHMTLGNLSVRLRNSWTTSVLSGNMATSTRPHGSDQFHAPAGVTRGGNILTTTDGIETDAYVLPGSVAELPTPSAEHRGKMIRIEGVDGKSDALFICEKEASGKYVWRQL